MRLSALRAPIHRRQDLVLLAEAIPGESVEPGGVAGRPALALLTATSVAGAVVACWAGGADYLLLIGQHVLRPADVSLVMWSLGVLGCASSLVMVLIRPRPRRVRRPEREVRGAALGGLVAVALLGSGVWCVGRAVVVDGVAALGSDTYTVLNVPATEGCPVVAHEADQLRSSSGDLYTVGLLGYARAVGSWRADEIQFPVRDGRYDLQWNGDTGTLALHGDRGIWPNRLQLSCTS